MKTFGTAVVFLSAALLFCEPALAQEPSCHGSVPAAAPASDSLYQLDMELVDQRAVKMHLKDFSGKPLVISMFFGSCKSVCPLLISRVKQIQKDLPAKLRGQVQFLMVSFDPTRDTPELLATLTKEHHLDAAQWTLAQAKPRDVETLAAVLGIKYRRLPDGDFNHSSVITVADAGGRIVYSKEGLNQPSTEAVAAIVAKAPQ